MKKLGFRLATSILALSLTLPLLVGCKTEQKPVQESGSQSSSGTQTSTSEAPATQTQDRRFTDSVGREITLPQQIQKVAPSGPLAQVVLYTAYPDKLAGLAKAFGKNQLEYFPEKFHKLPEFGQFYGDKGSLNMENLLAAQPDLIVDIGEAKKTMKEDMDGVQKKLEIPTAFVEARLPEMPKTYQKLAELFNEPGKTSELAAYCEQVLERAKKVRESLKEGEKIPVYWAMGDKGLNTNAEESFQAEVLQLVGADNVAKVKAVSRGGGSEVSFEQLLSWKPKYILVDNPQLLETMQADSQWQDYLQQTGAQLVLQPTAPYGVLSNPPSVNRILGISWLGQLLYPDQYQLDLRTEFRNFYKLFYQVELTDKQLDSLLEGFPNLK